jgi:hypothetical protein
MNEMLVTGAYAKYRGERFLVLSGGKDWVALRADPDVEFPDAIDRGHYRLAPGQVDPWVKVPLATTDGLVDVDVTATLSGHRVSVQGRLTDGRMRVWFVGSPNVADDLGLDGDQYMGWTGIVPADDLTDIRVEETPRA